MHTQRQQALIQAAIHLTATEGIQKLTIRNVAAANGITEAAVYRHFESKHALLKAIIAYLHELLSPRFKRLHASDNGFSVSLQQFLVELFTLLQENSAFTLMLFAEETFNVDPELRPELKVLLESNLHHLTQFYTDAANQGCCRTDIDPSQLAMITFGAIRLTVSKWHLQQNTAILLAQAEPLHQSLSKLFSLQ